MAPFLFFFFSFNKCYVLNALESSSFNLHNSLARWVLLSPVSAEKTEDVERLSDLPEDTQLVGGGTRFHTPVLAPGCMCPPLHHHSASGIALRVPWSFVTATTGLFKISISGDKLSL